MLFNIIQSVITYFVKRKVLINTNLHSLRHEEAAGSGVRREGRRRRHNGGLSVLSFSLLVGSQACIHYYAS